jgi:hypothetical protein
LPKTPVGTVMALQAHRTRCLHLSRDGDKAAGLRPELVAAVRYFGRNRTGWIRDGVLLRVG